MSLAEREQQIYAKISKKLLDTGEKERYVLFGKSKRKLFVFKGLLLLPGSIALVTIAYHVLTLSSLNVCCTAL